MIVLLLLHSIITFTPSKIQKMASASCTCACGSPSPAPATAPASAPVDAPAPAPVDAPAPAPGITLVQTYEGLTNAIRGLSNDLGTVSEAIAALSRIFPLNVDCMSALAKRMQEIVDNITALEASRKILGKMVKKDKDKV